MMTIRLFNLAQASRFIGKSRVTLYKWVEKGRINVYKLEHRKTVLFSEKDLIEIVGVQNTYPDDV